MVIQGSLEIRKYEKVLFAQVFGCDEATSRINLSRIDLTSRVGIQISAAGGSQAKQCPGWLKQKTSPGKETNYRGIIEEAFQLTSNPLGSLGCCQFSEIQHVGQRPGWPRNMHKAQGALD